MSEHPYQYVVLRCVPRVDREEFVNVGVALYCQATGYLRLVYRVNGARLLALSTEVEPGEVVDALDGLSGVCEGKGPAAGTSLGERFGHIVAPRSTVVQPGPVHSGLTEDAEATLEKLVVRLVT